MTQTMTPTSALTLGPLPPDLRTPCLVVDLDVLTANVRHMQAALDERGIRLRPHAKTHKSLRVAAMQRDAGARGLTVGTVGEAKVFAEGGFDDLFIAYPLWPVGKKAQDLREVVERASVTVGIDSVEGVKNLAGVLGPSPQARVLVEIDSGGHRTGVEPERAGALARVASDLGFEVEGVFTHAGHSYRGPDVVAAVADQEAESLGRAAESVKAAGLACPVVSAGSTPTALRSSRPPVTEERPGTYVFYDRIQATLGSCHEEDVALYVAATVVSRSVPRQFVIDAGAKALARDTAPGRPGLGGQPLIDGTEIVALSDYHGTVSVGDGAAPQVGQVIRVMPNHVCPVVNLFDELVIVQGGAVVDTWPVDARGRSQ
jgi:D-serine deaminase-like pyridoxal phosphate-dependent protein